MPDQISGFTLERSPNGTTGDPNSNMFGTLNDPISVWDGTSWTVGGTPFSLDPSSRSFDDATPPNPTLYYRLTGHTQQGLTIPYNVVSVGLGCATPVNKGQFTTPAGPVASAPSGLFVIRPSDGGAVFKIDPSTGSTLGTITIAGAAFAIFYESHNDRVYIGYQATNTDSHLAIYNPSTLALVHDIKLTASYVTFPLAMDYDVSRNTIWVSDLSDIVWAVNAATFNFNTIDFSLTPTTPPFDPVSGLAYCITSNTVAVAGVIATNGHLGWCKINPDTFTPSPPIDMGGANTAQGMIYCPDNDRVYLAVLSTGLFKVTPATGAFTQISYSGTPNGLAYNTQCKRVAAFTGDSGENGVVHYVDLTDSVATLQINDKIPYTFQGPAYDATNNLIWCGVGSLLYLNKFT